MAPALVSPLLDTVVTLNGHLSSTYFPSLPLPISFVLHAARVSLAYRGLRSVIRVKSSIKDGSSSSVKSSTLSSDEGILYDLAGYLIMAWGGSFLTAYLSNSTPLQLISPLPLVTYTLVHIYIGVLLTLLPPISPLWLDTLLPLLDGATRSNAIIGGINLARNHPSNPLLRESLLFQLLLGTIGACGGGQLAGTLGVFNRQKEGWSFSTPPFLKARGLLEGIDVVAAFAGAVAYSLSTGANSSWVSLAASSKFTSGFKGFNFSHEQGQAITTLVVAALFAYRAVALHWLVKTPKSTGKRLSVESAKSGKGRKSVGGK